MTVKAILTAVYGDKGKMMLDTQACKTPMADHIFRFWQHLETEHVRILLDLRRETGSVVYWDGSSFSDAVAKALVADYRKLEAEHEMMRRTLETIAGTAADQLQATQARGALANIGPSFNADRCEAP